MYFSPHPALLALNGRMWLIGDNRFIQAVKHIDFVLM